MAEMVFQDSYLRFFPSLILPDEALANLATWGEYINDEASMRRWVGSGWAGLSQYCDQILPILKQGQALDKDRGEVFDAWALRNDIKKGRCPNPLFNEEKANFDARRVSWMIEHGHRVTGKASNKKVRGAAKPDGKGKGALRRGCVESTPMSEGSPMPDITVETAAVQDDENQAANRDSQNKRLGKAKGVPRKVSEVKRRVRQPLQELPVNKTIEVLSPTRSRQNRQRPARYQNGADS